MQRKKKRILIDTNIFSNAYGHTNPRSKSGSQEAIHNAKNKDVLIYPTPISRELLNTHDKKLRKKFFRVDRGMRKKGRYVKVADDLPDGNYGFDQKDDDRYVYHAAIKTDTDMIVTDDKDFRKRINEKKSKIRSLSSSAYNALFKRKKNYKRRKG